MFFTLWKPCVMFLLTSQLYSFNCLSCGNVICGTSYFYSLNFVSCGIVICGIFVVCLATYTTISTAFTTISTIDGSILPLIIFCAFIFVLSYLFFIPKLEAPRSSTLFFLLRELLKKSATILFLFFSVIYISSLVFYTLVGGFYGFSFSCTNKY